MISTISTIPFTKYRRWRCSSPAKANRRRARPYLMLSINTRSCEGWYTCAGKELGDNLKT